MYSCLIVLILLSVDEHLNFPSEFLSYNSNGWNEINFYPKVIHPRYVTDTGIKTNLQSTASIFWYVTQRSLGVSYRRFGTTCRLRLQEFGMLDLCR